MKAPKFIPLLIALLMCCTWSAQAQKKAPVRKTKTTVKNDTIKAHNIAWWDSSRKRLVPVAIYEPPRVKGARVVIVSHGYSQNDMEAYHQYTYITNCLAKHGYFVVSIQHELSTDPLLATTGRPIDTRMSNWERGTDNIMYVLGRLRRSYPQLDYRHITLIGHSNGGDMSMLFAKKYPKMIDKVISLDNRRMPMPRETHPHVYSIRSSDQPADEGVLPTAAEQKRYGIRIVTAHCMHNDMDNDATPEQRKEISNYILSFLKTP